MSAVMFAGILHQCFPALVEFIHVLLHVGMHVQQSTKLLLQFINVPTAFCRYPDYVVKLNEILRPKIFAYLTHVFCTASNTHDTARSNLYLIIYSVSQNKRDPIHFSDKVVGCRSILMTSGRNMTE